MNAWDENPATLRKYAREQSLNLPVLLDGREVADKYGTGSAVPAVFWINRQGRIVDVETEFRGPRSLKRKTARLLDSG